jgi:Mg/Co/Ni transporter MgtE
VAYYLRNHPRDVARVLESARAEHLKEFINGLPEDDRPGLFGNLLPQTAATYLADVDPAAAAAIVARLRSASAAQILGTMPRTKRWPILDALPLEKRTHIRHLLRYPDDAVGSLMLTNTLACRQDATIRRAKHLVRRFADTELPVMVVVDDAMKPVGLIAVSKLLRVREREFIQDHMRFVPGRLRAHAEIHTVLTLPTWNTEDYLPVVENDEHYVGLLPKSRLHGHALATRVTTTGTSVDLATTVLDVADLLWNPAAQILARASTTTLEDPNE